MVERNITAQAIVLSKQIWLVFNLAIYWVGLQTDSTWVENEKSNPHNLGYVIGNHGDFFMA